MSLQNIDDEQFFEVHQSMYSTCSHEFMVVNWVKTEKAKNASQVMCRKCTVLIPVQDIVENNSRFASLAQKHYVQPAEPTPDIETAP